MVNSSQENNQEDLNKSKKDYIIMNEKELVFTLIGLFGGAIIGNYLQINYNFIIGAVVGGLFGYYYAHKKWK